MAAPAVANLTPIASGAPNQTLDNAIDLGNLLGNPGVVADGSIGKGSAGAADVEWYSLTLDHAARLDLVLGQAPDNPGFQGVLSLYNNDPYDYMDPLNPSGHRLLEQVEASSPTSPTQLERVLAPGTYYVAVSGKGNLDFNPLIADSGMPGRTGAFTLEAYVTDIGIPADDGPMVVSTEPAAGAKLASSPFAIRIGTSTMLDGYSPQNDQNVFLFYTPAGGVEQTIPIANINYAYAANELQLFPMAPLAPGHYTVFLGGDASLGNPVITDASGIPLGTDVEHPFGQDFNYSFDVTGIEGTTGNPTQSNDIVANAVDLKQLTTTSVVRVAAAIGDDPSYNPANAPDPYYPDPIYNPANDVDMYHFHVGGTGRFALIAEVFAGRIGSPLDAGISLFKLDPVTHAIILVDGDNNTYNPTTTTDRSSVPLFTDSALYATLTPGDYYIAVSGGSNTPSPMENAPLGSYGVLDPNVTHSALNGYNTGPYVLNLALHPASDPPHVVMTSVSNGQVLDQPPTQLVVRFDATMNIPQVAFQTYQKTSQETISSIFIVDSMGTRYFPRFLVYDDTNHLAQFRMIDALPNGLYELHLSGKEGLKDLAGNPVVGNDLSGDFVVRFTVNGPTRGVNGNTQLRIDQEPNDSQDQAQDLGIFFPRELQNSINIQRDPAQMQGNPVNDNTDVYQFEILVRQSFDFYFAGANVPASLKLSLSTALGQSTGISSLMGGKYLFGFLSPGIYRLTASGWNPTDAATLAYVIHVAVNGNGTNAPPLVSGPAPAVAMHLDIASPGVPASVPPPVNPPPPTIDPGGSGSPVSYTLPPATVIATTSTTPSSGLSQGLVGSAVELDHIATLNSMGTPIVVVLPSSESPSQLSSTVEATTGVPSTLNEDGNQPSLGQSSIIASVTLKSGGREPTQEDSLASPHEDQKRRIEGFPAPIDTLPSQLLEPPGGFTLMLMAPVVIPNESWYEAPLAWSLPTPSTVASPSPAPNQINLASHHSANVNLPTMEAESESRNLDNIEQPTASTSFPYYLLLTAAGATTLVLARWQGRTRKIDSPEPMYRRGPRWLARRTTVRSALRSLPRFSSLLSHGDPRTAAPTEPASVIHQKSAPSIPSPGCDSTLRLGR